MQRLCSWPVEIKVGFLLLLFLGFTPGHGAYYREKSSVLFIVLLMITPSAAVKSGIASCQLMYLIEKQNKELFCDIISFVWISDT